MKIWNYTKRALLCAVTLLLVLGANSPASARFIQERSTTITTADLDLNTEEGKKQLERRIRRAARFVCPKAPGSVVPTRDCIKEAEASAWQKIRSRHMLAEAPEEPAHMMPRNTLVRRAHERRDY